MEVCRRAEFNVLLDGDPLTFIRHGNYKLLDPPPPNSAVGRQRKAEPLLPPRPLTMLPHVQTYHIRVPAARKVSA